MIFAPQANDEITIASVPYHFAEHPGLPPGSGFAYGQEGRAGIVFQLVDEAGCFHALKVFKTAFRQPSLVKLSEQLRPFAELPGLTVCERSILTPKQNGELLRQYPDLLYAVLMPWIEGQTWLEVVQERTVLSPEQSLALVHAFVGILVTLEQEGIAHGDLSGSNLIIDGLETGDVQVKLVDVEQLYAPSLTRPTEILGGSPGYAHHRTGDNLWQPDMDRFAGAVLLAEMLGWCDERVREAANGETYFAEDELQKECARYQLAHTVLEERWGSAVASLFDQAWHSYSLAECPPFGAWQITLPLEIQAVGTRDLAAWMAAGQAAAATEDWVTAHDAYNNALSLAEPDSSLSQELPLIIVGLERKIAQAKAAPDGDERGSEDGHSDGSDGKALLVESIRKRPAVIMIGAVIAIVLLLIIAGGAAANFLTNNGTSSARSDPLSTSGSEPTMRPTEAPVVVLVANTRKPTPTPTQTPRPTDTRIPTNTPFPTNTRQSTDTPFPTHTRQPTDTPFPTNTPQSTATPFPTDIPQLTATPFPIDTPISTNSSAISAQATIFDGFTNYGASGYKFSSNSVVAWDSNAADLLAGTHEGSSTTSFFLPYDAAPFNNPDLDKDARSGIVRMPQTELEQVSECPESGYRYHWVEANSGGVYCVRTRNGQHYAKIKLTSIGNSSLSFAWVYQPDGSRVFN
jgi:hypothetical protein